MNDGSAMDLKNSRHAWSLGHKLRRALWMVVWRLLGRPGPRFMSPWRVFLLRAFGARIGRDVLVCGGVKVLMPWNLQVGDCTSLSEEVDVYNFGQVRIGSNTCLSRGVWLCTGTHDYNVANFPLIWDDITVGDAAWLAVNCFVAPGVSIGDGAVVGACSVVTRDLEGWAVHAGNPCAFVKARRRPEAA